MRETEPKNKWKKRIKFVAEYVNMCCAHYHFSFFAICLNFECHKCEWMRAYAFIFFIFFSITIKVIFENLWKNCILHFLLLRKVIGWVCAHIFDIWGERAISNSHLQRIRSFFHPLCFTFLLRFCKLCRENAHVQCWKS